MAFTLLNVLEAPIAQKIYEMAQGPEPDETHARVLWRSSFSEPGEEFHIVLPFKDTTVWGLQRHLAEMQKLKGRGWAAHEMTFLSRELVHRRFCGAGPRGAAGQLRGALPVPEGRRGL